MGRLPTMTRHDIGKVRYLAEWTPWADVQAAARSRGMVADGEVSDYVEIDDFAQTRSFRSFALAVAFASDVSASDTWHCPRLYRQEVVANDHDDLGNLVKAQPDWETNAMWEVFTDEAAPTEAEPTIDYRAA